MSLFKINEDDRDFFTLETHPKRTYISSSSGITGSVYIYARHSALEKEAQPLSMFSSSLYNDVNLNELLNNCKLYAAISGNNYGQVSGYLSKVFEQQPSARKQQKLDIIRFTPPFVYNTNTGRKLATINSLMPFYRSQNSNYNYNISNYFCLNFFTSSDNHNDAVLLYPNQPTTQYPYGQYCPNNGWSFDFRINPKYTTDTINSDFKTGTIFHLSGVYAVSLLTGSSRDLNGYPDAFRIMLQVSSSTNIKPSEATPDEFTFLSDDNAIKRNEWSQVTIRHGGNSPVYDFGTGSFVINNTEKGIFVLTTSLATGSFGATSGPQVLAVGNYYEGDNTGTSQMVYFFANNTTIREGLFELNSAIVDNPSEFSFNHPLNAEVHELKIFDKYLTDYDLSLLRNESPTSIKDLLFYLPPYFTYESPSRSFHLGAGGIPVTPFQTKDGSTNDLFNVTMSFSIGGQFINLENYTKDFATNNFPKLLNLTSSVINETTDVLSANEFIFATASNRYRQYIVMPCDDGNFYPNYIFLSTGSLDKFKNDLGNTSVNKVTLRNLVGSSDKASALTRLSGSLTDEFIGPSPDNVSGSYTDSLAIYHRTRDNSSNQCVIFDISNIFYGQNITPGSVVLTDTSLSGSGNKISTTLKDDGMGGLYRADCFSKQATWSNIGNVFYNEGIILIKSPQLFFFGEQAFELEFKGEQNIYVMKLNLTVFPKTATSSSNPSYISTPASSLANDTDKDFVWLTTLYIHDENMNVIAKTNLAQPVMKRDGDKIKFNWKMDF